MASSDNLASIDPWAFRSPFADSWFTDAFTRETETLTKVLQKSLSAAIPDSLTPSPMSPFMDLTKPDNTSPTATTGSGLSGSDHEPAPNRKRGSIPPAAGGKVSKRKSRASKRSQTTYITADPANFRQMVQQVTGGVGLGNSHMQILKPEPQRLGSRIPVAGAGAGCLPTLDTSAFLLDHHHQQQVVVGPTQEAATVGGGPGFSGPGPLLPFSPSVGLVDGSAGLDFDSFASFPTLESWK